MAEFAPIPRASDATATTTNSGLLDRLRTTNLRSERMDSMLTAWQLHFEGETDRICFHRLAKSRLFRAVRSRTTLCGSEHQAGGCENFLKTSGSRPKLVAIIRAVPQWSLRNRLPRAGQGNACSQAGSCSSNLKPRASARPFRDHG